MITLELTEEEAQSLAGLVDAGLRAVGIRGARQAANLVEKLDEAMTKAESKKGAEEPSV